MRDRLGAPQYSYHFVLTGFLPALQSLGEVIQINHPDEADGIYETRLASGGQCVFLCFAPPHLVPITLRCPTIPVIAWEFENIPCEMWSDDPRSDWRVVFRHCKRAITLSSHTAVLIRGAMGADYPVFAIPTATYDAFAPLFQPNKRPSSSRSINFSGAFLDSQAETRFHKTMNWPPEPVPPLAVPQPEASPVIQAPLQEVPLPAQPIMSSQGVRARVSRSFGFVREWYDEVIFDVMPHWADSSIRRSARVSRRLYRAILPRPAPPPLPAPVAAPVSMPISTPAPASLPLQEVQLSGVVYTSVLSPEDGRKNWHDLLSAFLWAFRDEPAATLVLKMPQKSLTALHPHFEHVMLRFAPFACRVVLVYGFLADEDYKNLVGASDYYLNTSSCEGLCIPLMEFLSAGKPAIAPKHTAMADYLNDSSAFILRSSLEHNVWPFDPRDIFTTMRHRLDWSSIEEALRNSFKAISVDGSYDSMSVAAHKTMQLYCSTAKVQALLEEALGLVLPSLQQEAAE